MSFYCSLILGGAPAFAITAICVIAWASGATFIICVACYRTRGSKSARGRTAGEYEIPARTFKTRAEYARAKEAMRVGEEVLKKRELPSRSLPEFKVG